MPIPYDLCWFGCRAPFNAANATGKCWYPSPQFSKADDKVITMVVLLLVRLLVLTPVLLLVLMLVLLLVLLLLVLTRSFLRPGGQR